MTLFICPGIHEPRLSDRFVQGLNEHLQALQPTVHPQPYCILPTQHYAPWNGWAVGTYLAKHCPPQQPLMVVGFSAGVVGAIAAAQVWQNQGRAIAGFIAVDGWGVPQMGAFPFHRVSHDLFTHWSSALLGAGQDSFYADPPVDHLDLWQYPDRAWGQWVSQTATGVERSTPTTAIAFIAHMLQRYGCGSPLQPCPASP
jgi:hypothetical protein